MKGYAPIGPLPLLRQLEERNLLGKYHLVLVHEVLKDIDGYREMFLDKGYFLILDNGVVENGYPIVGPLSFIAQRIGATCVCVPDHMKDKDKTLRSAEMFLRGYKGMHWAFQAVMLIPQGKTEAEIAECAFELHAMFVDVAPTIYWGVPRWIANELPGGRLPTVRGLQRPRFRNKHFPEEPNIHMLGMSNDFADDILCTRQQFVMGIDSANPLVLGQKGIAIGGGAGHPERKSEGFDFWQEKLLKPLTLANISEVRRLINIPL